MTTMPASLVGAATRAAGVVAARRSFCGSRAKLRPLSSAAGTKDLRKVG